MRRGAARCLGRWAARRSGCASHSACPRPARFASSSRRGAAYVKCAFAQAAFPRYCALAVMRGCPPHPPRIPFETVRTCLHAVVTGDSMPAGPRQLTGSKHLPPHRLLWGGRGGGGGRAIKHPTSEPRPPTNRSLPAGNGAARVSAFRGLKGLLGAAADVTVACPRHQACEPPSDVRATAPRHACTKSNIYPS